MVEARLAAGEIDAGTYASEKRVILERIQDATLRISEELDDLQ